MVPAGGATSGLVLDVDEVGISYARHGAYLIRAAYRPVFRRQGEHLERVALEGRTDLWLAGEAVAPEEAAGAGERRDLALLRLALQAHNLHHLGDDDLSLIVDLAALAAASSGGLPASLDSFAGQVRDAGLDPDRLACVLPARREADCALLAAQLRGHGMIVGIGGFGPAPWGEETLAAIRPELVLVDEGWFRQVCREDATVRLFCRLVGLLQNGGSKVLVAGIGTGRELSVALRSGGDLLQGPLLGGYSPVGADVPEAPLEIERLLGGASPVTASR